MTAADAMKVEVGTMCRIANGGEAAADGTPSYLEARQDVIRLAPLDPALSSSGYVWRRVFLRGRSAEPHAGFWD